jgi:hypothetical protein
MSGSSSQDEVVAVVSSRPPSGAIATPRRDRRGRAGRARRGGCRPESDRAERTATWHEPAAGLGRTIGASHARPVAIGNGRCGWSSTTSGGRLRRRSVSLAVVNGRMRVLRESETRAPVQRSVPRVTIVYNDEQGRLELETPVWRHEREASGVTRDRYPVDQIGTTAQGWCSVLEVVQVGRAVPVGLPRTPRCPPFVSTKPRGVGQC